MFGHASKPARIYSYGARPPAANGELVAEQMRAGHRYRNALVEAEHKRRARVAEAVARHCPGLAALEEQLAALDAELETRRDAIAGRNAAARRRTGTPAERAALKALRERKTALWQEHKALRQATYQAEGFIADQAVIEAEHTAECKRLRAASGLYWGTYLVVEQSLAGIRSGYPPKFHRWTGDGRIAVQLQKGLAWEDALAGGDSRLRVEVLPGPGRKPRAVARLRVGSAGRAPVWAEVPFKLHRQPPPGTRVQWAYLHRERVACHDVWTLQFVLARDAWPRLDAAAEGACGVEVGWRRVEGGLRVAVWRGSDGQAGELVLPDADLARWERVRTLRATRDTNFNAARDQLAAWLRARGVPHQGWLAEAARTLAQWRSPARLAALALRWRGERFSGDAAAFEAAEAWRKQDKHLYEWEANARRNAIAWRNNLYRNFAADLRRRYRAAAVELVDWAKLARVPGVEESDAQAALRQWRAVASVGRLQAYVREAASLVVEADAAYTTVDCHTCGRENKRLDRGQRLHTCEGCSRVWDVDENAAAWLLDAAASALAAADAPGAARVTEDEEEAEFVEE